MILSNGRGGFSSVIECPEVAWASSGLHRQRPVPGNGTCGARVVGND